MYAEKTNAKFKIGEAPLISATKQLNGKADSIIDFHGMKELQTLLLDTSSWFGSTDISKSACGYHKGLFGAFSMLETIADDFFLGSLDTFAKIKVMFVDALGIPYHIHEWYTLGHLLM